MRRGNLSTKYRGANGLGTVPVLVDPIGEDRGVEAKYVGKDVKLFVFFFEKAGVAMGEDEIERMELDVNRGRWQRLRFDEFFSQRMALFGRE